MRIEEYRQEIDRLDGEIVRLLNRRAVCAQQIGALKAGSNRAAYVPEREREVLDNVARAGVGGPLPAPALQAIFREVIAAARALEHRLRVACWGPPASNSHLAARRRFGTQVEFVLTESIAEVYRAVDRGEADLGVVPVENSTEGVIAMSLDLFLGCELQICAETNVPIQHNLLSRAADISALKRVYTMFQATGQCRGWIERNLRGVELVDTTTTARAAALAAEDPEAGAIANPAAAEEYGLRVLAEHIEDNPRNFTRFWVIGRVSPKPCGNDKTSLLLAVPHEAGALARALEPFATHGVSLTFIESRPTRQNPWEYLFYLDVAGHARDPEGSGLPRALDEVRSRVLMLRILGSYPEAE
jgi:chorismate mutase/prephenate dehydratase